MSVPVTVLTTAVRTTGFLVTEGLVLAARIITGPSHLPTR